MGARAQVPVFLGEAEVDHVELVAMAPDAHQEVVRLYIAVDETLAVDKLHATQHLICVQLISPLHIVMLWNESSNRH